MWINGAHLEPHELEKLPVSVLTVTVHRQFWYQVELAIEVSGFSLYMSLNLRNNDNICIGHRKVIGFPAI